MQLQPIKGNSFGEKNTYLKQAKSTFYTYEKKYYKSLHYEALSRVHYSKFLKADKELADMKTLSTTSLPKLFKTIITMAKEKLISISYQIDSIHSYPTRFYAADNEMVQPHRYYNTDKL